MVDSGTKKNTACYMTRNTYIMFEYLIMFAHLFHSCSHSNVSLTHYYFCTLVSIDSSKEVWKILPSYEELRRGAIGRGKEVEVMSIRCHVN